MNPELSFAATGSLPRDLANAKARSNVSVDVVTVRTTSTSGISGTGLKKCRPTKRSARLVAAAMAATVRLDVLEAKIVAGGHRPSSSFHRAFLSSRSSVTASRTMSHPFRSAVVVVNRRRFRAASRSAAGSLPFSTNLASDFSIPPRALSHICCDTSRTMVSYPAIAATCAMPLPMRPHPSTPTRLMSLIALRTGGFALLTPGRRPRANQRADLVGETHERVHPRFGEGVLRADLPALQPVEHLLEPDLHLLVLTAMGTERRDRRRAEDDHRTPGEGREDGHREEGARRGGACADQRAGDAEPLAPQIGDVRHELHVAEAGLERRHLAGDLRRPREREATPSRAERALDRRKRTDLGLPRDAVRVSPLHLEQLVLLHPRPEGALDAAAIAGHDALGREALRSREPRDRAAPLGHEGARPLLEQRLPQVPRRYADVLAQGEQLGVGEALPDVVLPRLQLGRALHDALECLATDELSRHGYASALVFAGGVGRVSPEALAVSCGG